MTQLLIYRSGKLATDHRRWDENKKWNDGCKQRQYKKQSDCSSYCL